jgi:hypothetical protein
MNISLSISKLLFIHNHLVIPKLGVFNLESRDAYHHPVSHEFTPKYRRITFTANPNINDEVLILSLQTDDAQNLVKEFVKTTLASLNNKEIVYLENIGWFKPQASGGFVFEQDLSFNYDKDYFGLTSFEQVPSNLPQEVSPTPSVVSAKPKTNWKPWLTWAAVVLLLAILGASIYIFKDKFTAKQSNIIVKVTDNKLDEKNIVAVAQEDSIITASIDSVIESEIVDSLSKEIVAQSSLDDQNIANTSTAQYFIIAACFKSDKNAQDYLLKLKASGYENASIKGKTSSGLIRVCYAGFKTQAEANATLTQISDKEQKQLWIEKITE